MSSSVIERIVAAGMVGAAALCVAVVAAALDPLRPATGVLRVSAVSVGATEAGFAPSGTDSLSVDLLPARGGSGAIDLALIDLATVPPAEYLRPTVLREFPSGFSEGCPALWLRLAEVELEGGRYGLLLAPDGNPVVSGKELRLATGDEADRPMRAAACEAPAI
jgi:hypothetical protein